VEKAVTVLLITVLLIIWAGCQLRRAQEKAKEIQASRKKGTHGPL
jgi:hypothetical protein